MTHYTILSKYIIAIERKHYTPHIINRLVANGCRFVMRQDAAFAYLEKRLIPKYTYRMALSDGTTYKPACEWCVHRTRSLLQPNGICSPCEWKSLDPSVVPDEFNETQIVRTLKEEGWTEQPGPVFYNRVFPKRRARSQVRIDPAEREGKFILASRNPSGEKKPSLLFPFWDFTPSGTLKGRYSPRIPFAYGEDGYVVTQTSTNLGLLGVTRPVQKRIIPLIKEHLSGLGKQYTEEEISFPFRIPISANKERYTAYCELDKCDPLPLLVKQGNGELYQYGDLYCTVYAPTLKQALTQFSGGSFERFAYQDGPVTVFRYLYDGHRVYKCQGEISSLRVFVREESNGECYFELKPYQANKRNTFMSLEQAYNAFPAPRSVPVFHTTHEDLRGIIHIGVEE